MNDKLNGDFSYCSIRRYPSDISGEYILPDSFPDVRNLLYAGVNICEIKKYFSPSETEVTGKITYRVLFTCMRDGCESLESICFDDSFKTTVKCNSGESGSVCVSIKPISASGRMANPRKFALKTTLELTLANECCESAMTDALPTDESVEVKLEKAVVLSASSAELYEHSFSDNIELDARSAEIDKLIFSEVLLNVDCETEPFKLCGTASVCCIYSDKEGKYHGANKEVPYTISLSDDELEQIGKTDNVVAVLPTVCVSAVNTEPGQNKFDETKVLELDIDYDVDIMILRKNEIEVITDAYDTVRSDDPKYGKIMVKQPFARLKNNYTMSDSGVLESGEPLCFAGVSCSCPSIECTNDASFASSKLTATMIVADDGEVYSREIGIQSKFRLSGVDCADTETYGISVPKNLRIRFDSGRVYTDCEIYFDAAPLRTSELNYCQRLNAAADASDGEGSILAVYYPKKGEYAWDAAKEMKVPIEALIISNPSVNEDMPLTSPLIIEK